MSGGERAVVLRAGDAALTIDAARGARMSSLVLAGTEMLVGPPDASDAGYEWGCFLMAPWAGRIGHAVLDWRGEHHRLEATYGPHAIHGVVYGRPWTLAEATDDAAVLECDLGSAGWPFRGLVRQRYRLAEGSLAVTVEIEAERATPVVAGWHPWFRMNGSNPRVTLLADEVLETVDLVPTGRRRPVDDRNDLRGGAKMAGRTIDDDFPDVVAPAILEWRDRTLEIALEPSPATFVVYVRGDSFCVEPQTGWPNAIALAARRVERTGLVELEAGERFAATMRWRWSVDATDGAETARGASPTRR